MGRAAQLDDGRWLSFSEENLAEWAYEPGRLTPVLVGHDVDQLVGWCDKVTFSRRANVALLYGELEGGVKSRGIARLVRAGVMDGLSPGVKGSRGTLHYRMTGQWGDGDLVAFPELSFVWEPRLVGARWLGV